MTPYSGGTPGCNGLNKNAGPMPGRLLLTHSVGFSVFLILLNQGRLVTSALADAIDLAGFTFDSNKPTQSFGG